MISYVMLFVDLYDMLHYVVILLSISYDVVRCRLILLGVPFHILYHGNIMLPYDRIL